MARFVSSHFSSFRFISFGVVVASVSVLTDFDLDLDLNLVLATGLRGAARGRVFVVGVGQQPQPGAADGRPQGARFQIRPEARWVALLYATDLPLHGYLCGALAPAACAFVRACDCRCGSCARRCRCCC